MGVIATPSYVGYSVMTVVLSFNRFIQLLSTDLDALLFSRVGVWVRNHKLSGNVSALVLCGSLLLASLCGGPRITDGLNNLLPRGVLVGLWWQYVSERGQAPFLKCSRPWSRHVVQRTEMYIEIGGIFVSAIFYAFVVVLLYLKVRHSWLRLKVFSFRKSAFKPRKTTMPSWKSSFKHRSSLFIAQFSMFSGTIIRFVRCCIFIERTKV